ncbi:MAG TPA: DUF1592 domain-containing protein, partial [Gemmataceae bacterium]|nr:DUF1592 domain-containing protein [Gemmataceae bacterium]
MPLRRTLAVLVMRVLSVALVLPLPVTAAGKKPETPHFASQVAPVLRTYCVSCHGGKKPRGHLALDRYKDETIALQNAEVWDRVARVLRSGDMPPPKRPRPKRTELAGVLSWIDTKTAELDCQGGRPNPGRVTLRRLNRAEYNNTIRDLIGVSFHPAEDFPQDEVGYGFDNIGDVLSLPPLLFEKYLAAAEKIVTTAWQKPATRSRILFRQPKSPDDLDCARQVLERFATRAYRRPLYRGEVDRLVSLVQLARKQGDSLDQGIQLAAEAVLVSPHFLFRVERDGRFGKGPHRINEFELASRLSYFLWSSMPDEELSQLARRGKLRQNLEAQVRRMLKDPKSQALVENFADQWLELRNLKNANPNPAQFPSFDEALRSAMQKETELYFASIMREDRSILEFIDSDWTFVNERLAKHYGIPGVKGNQFRRVKLTDGVRGGILTQASILTVTSNPTRTSPVKRGKWILENIFNAAPPPPPPDAGQLKETKEAILSGSLRQRTEQHRANPRCASCHARMDPLG